MALLFAIPLMAAQLAALPPANVRSARVTASARASVRILSAAKVHLGSRAQPAGHKATETGVTLEDGSRRPAKLVEFQ